MQFTAVLEEPLQAQLPLISTSNGQLVLAVINNDGTQTTDSIVNSLQLGQGQGGNLGNLSPIFYNAIMNVLQQQNTPQQQPTASNTTLTTNTSNLPQIQAPPQGIVRNMYVLISFKWKSFEVVIFKQMKHMVAISYFLISYS